MYTVDTASCGAGAHLVSPSIPPKWETDAFEPERTHALRASVRDMEAQLVGMVFDSASPGWLVYWRKMPLTCSAALGDLAVLQPLLAA